MAALKPRLFGLGSVSQLAEGEESFSPLTAETVSSKLAELTLSSWGFVGWWSGCPVQ